MLNAVVMVRLEDADRRRLDALAARLPGARRSALARDLLRRALDALEADPSSAFLPSAQERKPA